MRREFPKGFLWGASTASHQVEGGTKNQWSDWEVSPERIADLERRGLFKEHGRENFISGTAADHYRRYPEDFALAKELGHTATRISLEWSRIEPEEGVFDEEEIRHYRDVIDSIRGYGIEPFVTLWHWTMPRWFYARGGFGDRRNIRFFSRFAAKMAAALPEVRFWITINEPEIYTQNSYMQGLWPPQEKNWIKGWLVFQALAAAHRAAYHAIKAVRSDAQIGVSKNNIYFEAYRDQWWDVLMKKTFDWLWNFHFLNAIRREQDFIGLNHYFHGRIKNWRPNQNENVRMSDLDWELSPDAIYHVLMDLRRYHAPIYITENGLADAEDRHRPWFIKETLKAVHRAIQDGADVRGYLHWALMDNFEWAHGFWPRFGLVEIDYATQERRPRPSAEYYKKIIEANAIDDDE